MFLTTGAIGGALAFGALLFFSAAAVDVSALAGRLEPALGSGSLPSGRALGQIPPLYLRTYRAAALTCPGLPWSVLAGIGEVETDHGRHDHISSAGAEGPMQFEPATFVQYAHPVPPHGADPPSPFDPVDAIYAAARDLCANGARGAADLPAAIFAYNHADAYVAEVLSYASDYALPSSSPVGSPALAAVNFAVAQLGTPYRWGGEGPGGFDCSGLTQAAYASAGVDIPRTSEAQWLGLPHVALGEVQPGDLLFFDPGEFRPGLPGHVGIYIGEGEMIDAPHSGAVVRVDDLAAWPEPLGAVRP